MTTTSKPADPVESGGHPPTESVSSNGSRECIECGCSLGRTYTPPIACDACVEHRRGFEAGFKAGRAADPATTEHKPLTGQLYSLTLARTVLRNLALRDSTPGSAEALVRFEIEHGYGLDVATAALSPDDKLQLEFVQWMERDMGVDRG